MTAIAVRNSRRRTAHRFWRSPLSRTGVVLLTLVVLFTLIGPFVYTASPTLTHAADALQGPSATYPLGTDELGRDILARLIHAGLISIPAGLLAVGIGAIIGSLVGTIAGFVRGTLDSVIMRIVDVMLSFPTMLTSIVVVAILGPSIQTAVLAVSIAAFPSYARVARSAVLPLRNLAFVEAAAVSNTSRLEILFRHVLPNALDVLLVLLVIGIGNGMINLAALSFLGIGVQPPQADWGVMLTQGVRDLYLVPLSAIAPATLLLITVLGINFIGEGLGSALRVDSMRGMRRRVPR
jgi:ABC-type dipeptide/oligopeptide/nickel transport system permease subunit